MTAEMRWLRSPKVGVVSFRVRKQMSYSASLSSTCAAAAPIAPSLQHKLVSRELLIWQLPHSGLYLPVLRPTWTLTLGTPPHGSRTVDSVGPAHEAGAAPSHSMTCLLLQCAPPPPPHTHTHTHPSA